MTNQPYQGALVDPLFDDARRLIKDWQNLADKIDETGDRTVTARVRAETLKTCALELGAALFRSHQ